MRPLLRGGCVPQNVSRKQCRRLCSCVGGMLKFNACSKNKWRYAKFSALKTEYRAQESYIVECIKKVMRRVAWVANPTNPQAVWTLDFATQPTLFQNAVRVTFSCISLYGKTVSRRESSISQVLHLKSEAKAVWNTFRRPSYSIFIMIDLYQF